MHFGSRFDAGRAVASMLEAYRGRPEVLVLALPRGGVPVGYEVACALGAPLDIFLVRKLGVPGREELAMGAIASGGVRVLNDDVLNWLHVPSDVVDAVAAREARELERRERLYRGELAAPAVAGRCVILVDDGLATGSSMRAAVAALKACGPARLVVAVPVAAPETCAALSREVDELISVLSPAEFSAVSAFYYDFSQIDDGEVRRLLELARRRQQGAPTGR